MQPPAAASTHDSGPGPADGAVGAVVIMLALLSAIGIFFMGWFVSGFSAPQIAVTLAGMQRPAPAEDSRQALFMLLLTALAVLGITLGVGLRRGRHWAFGTGVVFFTFLSMSPYPAIGVMGAVYCVLRLNGRFNPSTEQVV